MANATSTITDRDISSIRIPRLRDAKLPLATKLMLGFLLIIVFISAVYMYVGVRLISERIVAEAQEKVRNDLNAAREIYLSQLTQINDVVRFTAHRFFLRDALASGNINAAADELERIRDEEGLDILTVTDNSGNVLLRTSNQQTIGDNQSHDDLVRAVLRYENPVASTALINSADLSLESPQLAEQAYMKFIDTPLARDREETEETSGMMLKAAAPIFDDQQNFIGERGGGK